MKIAIGSDHAGFGLKQQVVPLVKSLGHEVVDFGTHSADPVDYPDFAEKVGLAVARGEAERGIMVCGSGIGACIAANKIPGVRAGNCSDHYSAHQGVEHDAMNVLVLGGRIVGWAVAEPSLAPAAVSPLATALASSTGGSVMLTESAAGQLLASVICTV